MTRIISLLSAIAAVSGCNPYSQFYYDMTGGKNVLTETQFISPSGEPKLRQGADPNIDTKYMLENGFTLIGTSCFNGSNINQNGATEQARKIHADTVIVYFKYTNTLPDFLPATTPTYSPGTIYGSGGFTNYSETSYTATYIPFNAARYDYLATYWVRLRNVRLGIYYASLTDEMRKKIGSNKGVYITLIVNNTPAFNSDLLAGDIIRRINGVEVIDDKQLSSWVEDNHPSEINFEIYRDGVTINKKVQLQ